MKAKEIINLCENQNVVIENLMLINDYFKKKFLSIGAMTRKESGKWFNFAVIPFPKRMSQHSRRQYLLTLIKDFSIKSFRNYSFDKGCLILLFSYHPDRR